MKGIKSEETLDEPFDALDEAFGDDLSGIESPESIDRYAATLRKQNSVNKIVESGMKTIKLNVYLFTRTGLTASVLPGWDNLSSRCTP
ncbi:hypothetical protein JD551_20565 [Aeromonas caviae]|uniref:hypothetical protein n=1 Tax=Aeromonas caviae TaxID=648 RepID=UPI00191D040C|nr:hypothetical protein [Aeromonas caviae]MBL0551333.1 hypothetical protein [Aeromonas caviae]